MTRKPVSMGFLGYSTTRRSTWPTTVLCPIFRSGRSISAWRPRKKILGFFITGHPLQKYEEKLQAFAALSSADICAMTKGTGKDEMIITAGIITNVRVLKSKRGDFYAQAVLEDMLGTVEMIVFPDAYKRNAEKLKLEVPVLIRAGLRVEEDTNPKLTITEITPLEDVKVRLPRSIRIQIPLEVASPETVDELHAFCTSRPGEAKVLFDLDPGRRLHGRDGGGNAIMSCRTVLLCSRGRAVRPWQRACDRLALEMRASLRG